MSSGLGAGRKQGDVMTACICHCHIIHLSIHGHVGDFPPLASVSSDAVNMGVNISQGPVFDSLGYI